MSFGIESHFVGEPKKKRPKVRGPGRFGGKRRCTRSSFPILSKKGVPFDTPFLARVHNAEAEFKSDFDAFMSFANDRYLALLCPMFAKNAILCAMTQFSNILTLLLKPSLLCPKPLKPGIQSIAELGS